MQPETVMVWRKTTKDEVLINLTDFDPAEHVRLEDMPKEPQAEQAPPPKPPTHKKK